MVTWHRTWIETEEFSRSQLLEQRLDARARVVDLDRQSERRVRNELDRSLRHEFLNIPQRPRLTDGNSIQHPEGLSHHGRQNRNGTRQMHQTIDEDRWDAQFCLRKPSDE